MLVIPYYHADTSTFSYLVTSGDEAAIVDPVLGYDPVSGTTDPGLASTQLEANQKRRLKLRCVLETHAHADHLSAAQFFARQTGAQVVIGAGIVEVQRRFKGVYNLGSDLPADGSQFDRLVSEGDPLDLGETRFEVLATPGHTSDSVSYLIDRVAFVGDTLFAPGYGSARCDFPGGDAGLLYDSIQRLHGLPPATRLYLCHDYPEAGQPARCETTVAASRAENIHVRDGISREDFVAMRTARDASLKMPRLLLPAIQFNIRAGRSPDPEGNGVAYLKIPVDADLGALAR